MFGQFCDCVVFGFLVVQLRTCGEGELLSLRSEWGDELWAPQDGGLGWPVCCLITPDWLCCAGLPEPCCCWGCCWAWPKSLWMGCCNNILCTHRQRIWIYPSFTTKNMFYLLSILLWIHEPLAKIIVIIQWLKFSVTERCPPITYPERPCMKSVYIWRDDKRREDEGWLF